MTNHSVSELNSAKIFPVAFGNEQETGMQVGVPGSMDEPYGLAKDLDEYTPTELTGCDRFLRNGSKLYIGGTADKADGATNIERATPEVASPGELPSYIRAGGYLIERIAESYAKEMSNQTGSYDVRIQDRVVDSNGSRKACHDNFGVSRNSLTRLSASQSGLPPLFLEHLVTRQFVTGAGLIRSQSVAYAQKTDGLQFVSRYGYGGGMYRVSTSEGTPRIEVRCSDANISDWANWMRIGSTALVLALSQTPLAEKLDVNPRDDQKIIADARLANLAGLTPEGGLFASEEELNAVDFQQEIAELAMDKLQLYIDDLPDQYFTVAKALYDYCDDYRKVLNGEATIDLLAKRADWAAKFGIVLRRIDHDRSFGITRFMGDDESKAQDLRYDSTLIHAQDGEIVGIKRGTGHKLRKRGFFEKTVSDKEIIRAYLHAPENTRAGLRADILTHYQVQDCDWDVLTIADEEDNTFEILLSDVRQTKLKKKDATALRNVKQIR